MKKILITILIVLILGFIFILYNSFEFKTSGFVVNRTVETSETPFFYYEIVRYPSNVEIFEPKKTDTIKIGITGDPWNINFGKLSAGMIGERYINLANYKEEPFRVRLVSHGNISSMVSFTSDDMVLKKGKEVKVTVFLNTTISTKPGNYTGEIDIISEKSKIPFLGNVLWKIR